MENKKNILLLVTDHQAFYGHTKVQTPNFDRLAEKGVNFTHTYCASPLCCPSRKSMLTGLYPHRHGQIDNSFETSINSHQTYIDVLKENGYDNYYFGKWHASAGVPKELGCQGISYENYSNPYKHKEYLEYIHRNHLKPAAMLVEKNMCEEGWIDDVKEGDIYTFPRPLINEAFSGILKTSKESHESFYIADSACRQLEQIKIEKSKKPFMMRVDCWGPHQPYHPTKEYADMYPPTSIREYPSFHDDLENKPSSYRFETGRGINRERKLIMPNPMPWSQWQKILSRCYGQITMVDEAMGSIIKKLEELGLDENTLIIWTADHGDALSCHGGHFDKGFYLAEEVMRIPLAMSCKEILPKNTENRQLISNVDLAPTILGYAKLKFDQQVDGVNILNLYAKEKKPWRKVIFAESHGHLEPYIARMVISGCYKYIYNEGDIEELYNLDTDQYELFNLAQSEAHKIILLKMRNLLKEMQIKYKDSHIAWSCCTK